VLAVLGEGPGWVPSRLARAQEPLGREGEQHHDHDGKDELSRYDGHDLSLPFRRREWGPAIEAAGISKPARIYDLRSTFASNALADGVSVFHLARIMGTSVRMIERHYGALLDGSGAEIARLLDTGDAQRARPDEVRSANG
jgi:hypothetical protein